MNGRGWHRISSEADNEYIARETAEALGFSWDDAIFGDVMAAYQAQYPTWLHLTL